MRYGYIKYLFRSMRSSCEELHQRILDSPHILVKSIENYVNMTPVLRYILTNDRSSFEPFQLPCYDPLLDDWWYEEGKVKWLHTLNEIRVPLIYNTYVSSYQMMRGYLEPHSELQDIKLLDVGCGGGVLAEALAELGFSITGVDPNQKMIVLAKNHAEKNKKLSGKCITYIHTTIEDFAPKHKEEFDGVIISEVLEHVMNKKVFLQNCIKVLKPGGSLFITMKNRTEKSLESLLVSSYFGTIPLRTQNWLLYQSPESLQQQLANYGCSVKLIRGFAMGVLTAKFNFREYTDFWYYMYATKNQASVYVKQ